MTSKRNKLLPNLMYLKDCFPEKALRNCAMHFLIALAVACLLFPSNAGAFNFFGPSDYEECAERAAKDARTNAALRVLLKTCRSKFQARRKTGGGYIWCPYIADLSKSLCIDVAKPTVSKRDRARLEELLNQKRANLASRTASARIAQSKMRIIEWDLACDDPFRVDKRTYDPSYASSPTPVYEGSSDSCVGYHVTGQIRNGSNIAVRQIGIGLQLLYAGQQCNSAISETHRLNVNLAPGATTGFSFNVSVVATGTLSRASSGCLAVTSFQQ
jgi:hypothetical protein